MVLCGDLFYLVWCNVVWCRGMWRGVVQCGVGCGCMVWFRVVLGGVLWFGVVLSGAVWCCMTIFVLCGVGSCCCVGRCCMEFHGVVLYGVLLCCEW